MIPKIIHLTYKSKNPEDFPKRCTTCFQSVEKYFLPAGYRIEISDDADMDATVKAFDPKLFELYKAQPIIVRTDIWRIVVLYTRGGYYMDTDVLWEKSPIAFLDACESGAIVCQEKISCPLSAHMFEEPPIQLGNYFFACEKNHWFFKKLIDRMFKTLDPRNEVAVTLRKGASKLLLLINKSTIVGHAQLNTHHLEVEDTKYFALTLMKAGPLMVSDVYGKLENRSAIKLISSPSVDNRVGTFAQHLFEGNWNSNPQTLDSIHFKAPKAAPNANPTKSPLLSTRFNLGCGNKIKEGFVNIDKYDTFSPDKVMDLEKLPWDLPSACAEYVLLNHVLEHLGASSDIFLGIMKELYRICRPGAIIEINVPHPLHRFFRIDPTHVRRVSSATLEMFSKKIIHKHQKMGSAMTPLAVILDVDFEIIQNTLIPDMGTVKLLRSKGILHPTDNNDILIHSEIYCDLISEIRLKLRRV